MSSPFSKFAPLPVVPVDPAVEAMPTTDIPVTPTLQNSPARKSSFNPKALLGNKLFLLGIFGVVMLTLAVTLQLASRKPATTTDAPVVDEGPNVTGTDTLTTSWPLYQDPYKAYELKIPTTWSALDYTTNIETTKSFTLKNDVKLELSVAKTTASSLTAYLEQLDATRTTLWSGRPSRSVGKLTAIRIGDYDGFERTELISATGVEYLVSYIMVDQDVFAFSLIPTGVNKTITNQELTRELHLAQTTFKIMNVSERQGEWKTYDSVKVEGLNFPSYAIAFPATWSMQDKKSDNSLDLLIARNGYKISLNQAAVGSAVCLFKDSPSFQGSSGDLRTKDFTEIKTDAGYILRRYFKGNEGDNSVFLFCGKKESDQYFQAPLAVGGLTYVVPAKYDAGVIKEMDNIVKSLMIR